MTGSSGSLCRSRSARISASTSSTPATRESQVFDSQGQYLTQWGRPGSGPGEFDFGTGLSADDFAGSIVVDDDGFVDVADVGNRRIQKFAR
jgi:hypothetical protein